MNRTLVSVSITLAVVAAFVLVDRYALRWYSQDVGNATQQIDDAASDLAEFRDAYTRDKSALELRIEDLENNVENALATDEPQFDEEGFTRDVRIGNAVVILSLLEAYGGFQSTGSAAGRACSGWLLFGEGSVTDCGFQRTD